MALVFNGTNQYATHNITPIIGSAAISIVCTFKTGSVVTGVAQYPFHINKATSYFRGWGIEISTTGEIRSVRGTGTLLYTSSLGIASPNTTYIVVITKDEAGLAKTYLNNISNTTSFTNSFSSDTMSRIITGAIYNNGFSGYMSGKVTRIAYYNSVLTNSDINILFTANKTPSDTISVPTHYWVAVDSDTATQGGIDTIRTGATYDSDTLLPVTVPTIINSNNGGGITSGSLNNTVTYANFSAAPTSGTLGNKLLSNFIGNTTNATFDFGSYVDSETYPEPGISHNLILTYNSETATISVPLNFPTGMIGVTINAPDTTNNKKLGYWIEQTGRTISNNDKLIYTISDVTGSPDGGFTSDNELTTSIWHWVQSTGIMYEYVVTISEEIIEGIGSIINLPLYSNGGGGGSSESAFFIQGSGFGVAPNVVVAEYFMDYDVGMRMQKGDWDSALYGGTAVNNYPKIFELGNTRGFGSRDTDGDNGLTGFVKQTPMYSDFMAIWQMGVPDGKFFSGASAERTLPPSSNLKMMWHSDKALDDPALADLVSLSRPSPGSWAVVGNQSNVSLYVNGTFDWDIPNTYLTYHKVGANAFINPGKVISIQAKSTGLFTSTKTDVPLFRKSVRMLPSPVADNTTYSVTVEGQVASIDSGTGATLVTIINALKDEINTKSTNWSAIGYDSNSDGTPEALVISAVVGTDPSVTASNNLTFKPLLPGFDYLSTHWQGNNNQTNSLHVYPYIFMQTGTNCGSCVLLSDSLTFDSPSTTNFIPIKHKTWSDNLITYSPTASQRAGRPYWIRLQDGIAVDSGTLPA